MTIITLTTDFFEKDPYVAAVKGTILSLEPSARIVDISHCISAFDLAHGAYVVRRAYPHFPKGTVHIISLGPGNDANTRITGMKLNGHYFLGCDCGVFSLIARDSPYQCYAITGEPTNFMALHILAPAAVRLTLGESLEDLGHEISDDLRLLPRLAKVGKGAVVGHVIHVDSYGNLITSIKKADFIKGREMNKGIPYRILVGREILTSFNEHMMEVEDGGCFLIFNSDSHLQIGIKNGRCDQLLGLRTDSRVVIEFDEDP